MKFCIDKQNVVELECERMRRAQEQPEKDVQLHISKISKPQASLKLYEEWEKTPELRREINECPRAAGEAWFLGP